MSRFEELPNVIGDDRETMLRDWPRAYRRSDTELEIFNRYRHLASSLRLSFQAASDPRELRGLPRSADSSRPDIRSKILFAVTRLHLSALIESDTGNLLHLTVRKLILEVAGDILEVNHGLV